MIIQARVEDNQRFVSKILTHLQETALKYSQLGNDAEQLICNDSKFVLQRKLARLSRNGDQGKLIYLHAFDVTTLFEDIIRGVILHHYTSDGYSLDVYILADICQELSDTLVSLLSDKQVHVYVCHHMSSLQSKINTGRMDKKLILNFDPTGQYLPCDLFMYFGLLVNPTQIREMLTISMLDPLGKYIMIDTIPQRIDKQTKFIGKNKYGIMVQNDMTYFSLKNCPVAGKSVGDMISHSIFDASTNTQTALLHEEEEEDEDENNLDMEVQRVITDSLVIFTDRQEDNYLLNFIYQTMGKIKTVYSVQNAFFTLTKSHQPIKMACFLYIRQVPDFTRIAAFCNAWKSIHPNGETLIILILVSPVLEKAAADSFHQYHNDLNQLVQLATQAQCCSSLHCEKTLLKQFIMTTNRCGSSPQEYTDITQVIMAIFDAIDIFIRTRANSFQPVFHERELVSALDARISSDLNEDLAASFLYRGRPFTAKDGSMKVVVPFFQQPGMFVIKPDYQTHINVSTMTGVDFSTPVNDILNGLYEEYKEDK